MIKEIEKEKDFGEITPDDFGNAGSDLSSGGSSSNSSPSSFPEPQESEPEDDEEQKTEQVVLDESDVTFNRGSINNTKTVSQILEKFSEILDEER